MDKVAPKDNPVIRQAFVAYERQQRLINTQVGCALVVFLMPAGSLLDFFVYRDALWPFFWLRLLSSALGAAIWASLSTDLGRRSGKVLGVVVPLIPVVSIAGMIMVKDGFASPYYAGLNLVLLAVGAVLHWSLLESIIAVLLVLAIYTGAGIFYALRHSWPTMDLVVNNFYFISLMDIKIGRAHV